MKATNEKPTRLRVVSPDRESCPEPDPLSRVVWWCAKWIGAGGAIVLLLAASRCW